MPRKSVSRRKKRHYGDGRKYQRGRIWWVAFPVGDGSPEIRRTTNSPLEKDADILIAELMRQRALGELSDVRRSEQGGLRIAGVLEDYLARKRGKLAPGTMATYESQAKIHLAPFFGNIIVGRLTTDELSEYRDLRAKQEIQQGHNATTATGQKRKMSETSINRELSLLRSALNDLKKRKPNLLPSVPYFPMEREDNAR